jgi:prepilin-type processing-associated H-X9-DG protein
VKPWVNGWLTYDYGSVGVDGVASDTNINYLISGTFTSTGPYVKAPGVFKCPADPSCCLGAGGPPRVRSISMNQAIGCNLDGNNGIGDANGETIGGWLAGNGAQAGPGPWNIYQKDADMSRPAPANLWLLLDEHPDSINDGAFAVQIDPITDTYANWIDHASALHGGGCGFTFCDGHSVIHKWRDPNWKLYLRYPPQFTGMPQTPTTVSVDLRWMAEHTSAYKDGSGYNFSIVPD